MSGKKVIIIGAGIGGMSAGCFAQMNGFETEILEMHSIPGGLCTAWDRKGYRFDGCVHWLTGTDPQRGLHKLWAQVGAMNGLKVHYFDRFIETIDTNGNPVVLYADPDKLTEHFNAISPEDKEPTQELARLVRLFMTIDMALAKPPAMFKLGDIFKMMKTMKPYMKELENMSKITLSEFAARFKNSAIASLITGLIPEKYSLSALVMTLADYASKNAGFPIGGSLLFAKSIAKRYESLGGKFRFKTKVKKVLIEKGKAVGVELENGETISADYVVSAADGFATYNKLLEGKYTPKKVAEYYGNLEKYETYTSAQVFLGVDADLSGEPDRLVVALDKPVSIAGAVYKEIALYHYCSDPGMAPKGKSVITALFISPYEKWVELGKDLQSYETEKERLAELTIQALEKRFPQTKDKTEAIDVVSPLTYVRYTGIWRGAYMAWYNSPKSGRIMLPNTLSKLKNFYMCGMWTMPAGLPTGVITGNWAAQLICRDAKVKFETK